MPVHPRARLAGNLRTFFGRGKVRNTPSTGVNHPNQLESAKMRMNSVLGENLEDLYREQDGQRSARQSALLNSVQDHQELEWPRSAPQSAATRKKDTIVGTSTSCSASFVSRTAVRIGTSSGKILGTSITCSGSGMSVSKKMHDVRKLFHYLRRRIVESRQRRDSIDDLQHGAPQNPLLRPGQGRKPVRPCSAGHFFVEAEELRLGSGRFPDRRRKVHLAPPAWQSSVLVRSGAYSRPRAIATVIRSCLSHEGAVAVAASSRRCRMQPKNAR